MDRLNRVIEGRADYLRLLAKTEELASFAEKITTAMSQVPKSNTNAVRRASDTWDKLVACQEECFERLRKYTDDFFGLTEELGTQQDDTMRRILQYRYLDGYTVEEISNRVDMSVRSVYRLLSLGRDWYYENYEKEKKL